MTRFCEVVVSIAIMEKSEIWITRDNRKPAPVLAIDSTRDIDRLWLLIRTEIGGREDLSRVAVPPAMSWLDRKGLNIFWQDAIIWMVEKLHALMPRRHDSDLFLGAGSGHRGRNRGHTHRVSPVLGLELVNAERVRELRVITAVTRVTDVAEVSCPVLLAFAAPQTRDDFTRYLVVALNTKLPCAVWFL